MLSEGEMRDDKTPPLSSRGGGGGGKKDSSGGSEVAVESPASIHLTAKSSLSEYLKRGESPGEAIASPMSFLTNIMGMREQTVVFGPNNGYLHHTACLARTLVMEMALATILTGKLTVASIKGDLYKTFVDVARVRPGLVQRSFIEFLPTEFEGENTAFLPGLHHKYASYRVFGTEDQIAAFQTHMKEHLAVLQESIALEYTSLAEAAIHKSHLYCPRGRYTGRKQENTWCLFCG